ncbi:MAG: hypothetical protein KJP12_06985 [Acidimicrobiia bacterium]|nr:hypothetical protein [Acidimicrobiia bacterium]
MKRALLSAIVVGGIVLAAVLPVPESDPVPVFPEPVAGEAVAAIGESVWYCAAGDSDDRRDAELYLATLDSGPVAITWPSPFGADDADVARRVFDDRGAEVISVSDFLRRGPVPALVEFESGPAAAAVASMVTDEGLVPQLSGTTCRAAVSKEWHIAGGTTRDGAALVLRLFNPFPDVAKVGLAGASEFGSQPLGDVIDVAGRSFRDIDLSAAARFLDDLSLTMTVAEGQVVPVMLWDEGADRAVWSATGLSTSWDFPFADREGLVASIVIYNPGPSTVIVEVDSYGSAGLRPAVATLGVDVARPLRVLVGDLDGEADGYRIRASGPITASLIVEGLIPEDPDAVGVEGEEVVLVPDGRLGAMSGIPVPAERWLLPGAGAARSVIHLMNPEPADATVTLVALGSQRSPEKVLVAAGGVLPVTVPVGSGGYLVESDRPVSVVWSVEVEGGFALFTGVEIGD